MEIEKTCSLDKFLDDLKDAAAFPSASTPLPMGLEYVQTACSKCSEKIYRFTGLVKPTDRVTEWQSERRTYSNLIPLSALSEKFGNLIAAEAKRNTHYDGIPLTPLRPSISGRITPVCPCCSAEQRLSSFMGSEDDHARISAIGTNRARTEHKLLYYGVNLETDYLTERAIYGSFECSQYTG